VPAEWRKLKVQELEGLDAEWKQFRDSGLEQIAREGDRVEQYKQVYRLACEAAHAGDLLVYRPPKPVSNQGCRQVSKSMELMFPLGYKPAVISVDQCQGSKAVVLHL
jgi:hypothetical protein